MEFKFNHSEETIYNACGITPENIEEMYDNLNNLVQDCETSSEVVEKMGNNFSSHELAFVVNDLQKQLSETMNPLDFLAKLLPTSEDDEDNDSIAKA